MKVEIHPIYRGNLVSEVENFKQLDPAQSIPDRLCVRVKQNPDQIAINHGDQEFTFQEFDRLTNRIANRYLLVPGSEQETIGLIFGHTPNSIFAIYAVVKAGKIAVPLDRDYPPANLESDY